MRLLRPESEIVPDRTNMQAGARRFGAWHRAAGLRAAAARPEAYAATVANSTTTRPVASAVPRPAIAATVNARNRSSARLGA